MSLNAAMIQQMLDEGMDAQAILRVAWAMEGGEPRPKIPQTPANDRPRRLSSEERRRVYDSLCERDGERCSECACATRTIWRRNGLCNNGTWDWDSEYRNRMTIVYPTSNLEVDHRQPLWAGGDNRIENLWLLCVDCHKSKTATEASQRRRA